MYSGKLRMKSFQDFFNYYVVLLLKHIYFSQITNNFIVHTFMNRLKELYTLDTPIEA